MARQIINNGETGLSIRNKLNENFEENYSAIESLGSGSPSGSYATVGDLTVAFPSGNSNIYVVTADGNWYFWNGLVWTSGGVYQATEVENKSINSNKLTSFKSTVALNNLSTNFELADDVSISNSVRTENTITDGLLNCVKTSGTYGFIEFNLLNNLMFKIIDNSQYILYKYDESNNTGECIGILGVNFRRRLDLDFEADTGSTIDYLDTDETLSIGDTVIVKVTDEVNIYKLVNNVEILVFNIPDGDTAGFVVAGGLFGEIANEVKDANVEKINKTINIVDAFCDNNTVSDRMGLLTDTCVLENLSVGGATFSYSHLGLNIISRPDIWGYSVVNPIESFLFTATDKTKYLIYSEDAQFYYFYELRGVNKGRWHKVDKTTFIHTIDFTKDNYNIENEFDDGDELICTVFDSKLFLFNKTKRNIVLRIPEYSAVGFALSENGYVAEKLRSIKSEYLSSDILIEDLTNSLYERQNLQTRYFNKTWSVVGDSITEINEKTTKNYHEYISEMIGCKILNYGISGTGWRNPSSPGGTNCIYNRINDVDVDSDIITVFAGTNDNAEVGGVSFVLGTFGDTDPTLSFYGAVDSVISQLISRFPTKQIAVLTPLPRNYADTTFGSTTQQKMEQISDAIIQVCNKYSVPVLDLYRNSGFYPFNSAFNTNSMPDGLHPNEEGHLALSYKILAFLNSI